MSRIRILPDHVANQIAAGEVVERPVAVVKELVENALDAGATRVEVAFRHGGKSLIRVADNGCGMSADEALLALERHATSKIASAEDLNTVRSFGFRGEALPSVASVSRFTLRTRREEDEAGTEVLISGGKMLYQKACGMAGGTEVVVEHLFNSVPARRKFLKTDKTESAHIIQCVRLFALAHPEVAFSLKENDRLVMRSPACKDLIERIGEAWSRQVADELMDLPEFTQDGVRVRGAVMKPGYGRSSRADLQCFVNGRPVDNRTLAYAVVESYHTHMPRGRYPSAFLFVEIDPASVDVNVHPAKREVRFRNEGGVRRLVVQALGRVLGEHNTYVNEPFADAPAGAAIGSTVPKPPPSDPVRTAARKIEVAPPPRVPQAPPSASPKQKERGNVSSAQPTPSKTPELPQLNWRFLGLLSKPRRIALFETEGGLVLLNCRAAHERVAYEKLCAELESESVASQPLLVALSLDLDPVASAALEGQLDVLGMAGFGIEAFGRNFYRVTALPAWLELSEAEVFLRDLVEDLKSGGLRLEKNRLAHGQIALRAASKAVRLDDNLHEKSLQELIRRLMACKQPLTCPRGRPTLQEISTNELIKKFGLSSGQNAFNDLYS